MIALSTHFRGTPGMGQVEIAALKATSQVTFYQPSAIQLNHVQALISL